jgi:hypothetical protein
MVVRLSGNAVPANTSRLRAMNDWLTTAATTLGVDPLDESQVRELLGVARDVAHDVERKVTPLATFLLGAAMQRRIGHGSTPSDAFHDAVADLRAQMPGPSDA